MVKLNSLSCKKSLNWSFETTIPSSSFAIWRINRSSYDWTYLPLIYRPGVYLIISSSSICFCNFRSASGILGFPRFPNRKFTSRRLFFIDLSLEYSWTLNYLTKLPWRHWGRKTVTFRHPFRQNSSTAILIPIIENNSSPCFLLISPTFPWCRATLLPSITMRLVESSPSGNSR